MSNLFIYNGVTITLNVADAGSSVAFGLNLILTVFAALTQAKYTPVVVTDVFGVPNVTGSPVVAPVTVMVLK